MARPWRQNAEKHRSGRGGWLRAAVLGADDGVVSTASLMLGVAAASASTKTVLIAGAAGLVAGAMSMAAGEFVSVSSQRDAEQADINLEKRELASNPEGEFRELAAIYRRRGLDADLAQEVAEQLTAGNPLITHLRDELGLVDSSRARPLQAAFVSAASFSSLALLPIAALLFVPAAWHVLRDRPVSGVQSRGAGRPGRPPGWSLSSPCGNSGGGRRRSRHGHHRRHRSSLGTGRRYLKGTASPGEAPIPVAMPTIVSTLAMGAARRAQRTSHFSPWYEPGKASPAAGQVAPGSARGIDSNLWRGTSSPTVAFRSRTIPLRSGPPTWPVERCGLTLVRSVRKRKCFSPRRS